jgi:DNA-binding SARP family transcriptional activator
MVFSLLTELWRRLEWELWSEIGCSQSRRPTGPGGWGMDSHHGQKHIPDDCLVAERQTAYSLNRLTAAVNELTGLIDIRPSDMVERMLADLGNAAGCASAGIEALHKLRLWRAHHQWLAAELDAATGSFHLAGQQLGELIDAALADWEQQFEAASPGNTGRSGSAPGRQGRLRALLRRGGAQARLATTQEEAPPEQRELALEPSLALGPFPPSPKVKDADIAARVLGPLELTVAGVHVLRWSSLKARAVFQYLLINQDRPVRREVLMELEWPHHSHNSARNNLNVALCSLRNTLDWNELDVQAVLHKEGCYLLNPALTWWTDRNEFRSMINNARSARQAGNTEGIISSCRSAVQLYRGPLFEDDLEGEWFLPERRHLKELYLQALEYLAEIYCEGGQLLAAIEFGQQAISTDPCYEAAHRLLMRCYARQHQQQLVSRQYRLCAAALQDELDVAPTQETVQLFRTLTSATLCVN